MVITSVGQVINGSFGTLVITSIADGQIGYAYTLTDNTSGDATHDDFSVVLTDDDGDVATATLTINIIDDAPTARDDTDAVVQGSQSTDGNVMTGVGTTNTPAGIDTVGADDAEVSGVLAGTSGSFTTVPDGGVTISGAFGDLTLNPDGSYTYTLHAEVGDGGNDVFTYQLTDGDGDTETATLTITVPPDLKPTLDAPNAGEAGTVVDEAGLPARPGEPEGSGEEAAAGVNGDPSEITTGTINFTPGDTPATVTINGVVVTGIGQTFAGDYGTLTITGFNPNGSITYSYVLEDNVDHDTDATPFEEFDIQVTDNDGDTATDTLHIDIVDDAPIANNDTDSVTEDGPLVANGNVVTGVGSDGNPAGDDLVGADDSIVTNVDGLNPGVGSAVATPGGVAIVGQYGTLVIQSDGSYTYTLDNTNPVVQALSDGDTLTEQFEYTLLDNDGDTDTAVLTITINGDNDVPTVDVPTQGEDGTLVDEAGLPPRPGEPEGTGEGADGLPNNESDDSEITSGVITYTPGDGATTITINGVVVVVGAVIAGDYGTLEITAFDPVAHTINYTYTLEDNVDHDSDATPFETFEVVVSDSDGNPADDATGDLIIDIVNDAPIARDDTDSVVEGDATNGNVLTGAGGDGNPAGADTPGADDYAPNTVVGVVTGGNDAVDTNNPATVGVVIVGTFGNLVLNADGSYTYTATAVDPPENAEDVFTYTIIDNDGNMDSATLTIDVIDDLTPTVDAPNTGEDGTSVDEAGLPPRGLEPEGTGEGADGLPNNESDDSEITSGVINFTPGDTPATVSINGVLVTGVGQTFAGDYGTLEITAFNPNGSISYTYTLEDNVDHDSDATPFETFTVEVEDVDGDVASDDLIIDIVNDAPIARDDTDSVVEGDATNGNVLTGAGGDGNPAGADTPGADDYAPNTVVGVVTGGNDAVDTNNPATVGVVIVGTFGNLVLNADGSYTYTATAVDPPENAEDVFTYTIIDNDGNMDSATLTIDVIDDLTPTVDAPNTGEDGTSVDEAGLPPRGLEPEGTGEGADGLPNNESDDSEITSGVINFTPGDTPATVSINGVLVTGVGQTFAGDYGTLEITAFNPNGSISYTYTLEDNVDHDSDATPFETFTVEVEDVDGDVASDDLIIDIVNDAPIANDDTDSVIEGDSTNGNVLTGAGGDGNPAGADVPGADGFAPSTVVGVAVGDTNTNITNGTGVGGAGIAGTYGTLVLNADGSYTYEADPNTNPPPGAEDVFTYTIIDNDGNATNATLTIDVIDDLTPVAGEASAAVDDEGLSGGIVGGDGDIDADDGEAGAGVGDESVFTGTLQGTDGDIPTTFLFDAALDGDTATVGQETVAYAVSPDGLTLTATVDGGGRDGLLLFTIQITNADTGAYTLTLANPVMHPEGDGDETSVTLEVPYQMEDADGDNSASPGTLTIEFNDDTPTAVSAAAITSGLENGGGDSASANLDGGVGGDNIVANNMGADGGKVIFTAATITALEGQNLTHDLAPLSYAISGDGQLLTGYVELGGGAGYQDGVDTPIFTIQLQPGGQPNDYTITMIDSVDTVENIDFNDGGYNFVGGNGSWAGFTSGTNGDGVLDLLLTPMVNGVNGGTMNTNANEGGVGSGNSVALGEGVRVDAVQDLQAVPAPTPSGDYGTPANQNHVFGQHENVLGISALISTVNGPPGSTTTIQLDAFDETAGTDVNDLVGDGIQEAITEVVITHGVVTVTVLKSDGLVQVVEVDGIDYTVTFGPMDATISGIVEDTRIGAFTADGFDSIEFTNVGGEEFKIGDFNTLSVTSGPLDITVPISVVDGDGDTVTSGDLDIHIDGSDESPFPIPFAASTSQEEQLQKTAANSNTLSLAAAVAASGLVETQAAAAPHDDNGSRGQQVEEASSGHQFVASVSSEDDSSSAVSSELPEAANDSAPVDSSSSSSAAPESDHSLDDSAAKAEAQSSDVPAANDQGPASSSGEASPVAMAVGMPSAEALQAAGIDGNAQQGGSVEQIVADALGQGSAPATVDAILEALAGPAGDNGALANLASPAPSAVPAWDMAMHGASGPGADMMFKMGWKCSITTRFSRPLTADQGSGPPWWTGRVIAHDQKGEDMKRKHWTLIVPGAVLLCATPAFGVDLRDAVQAALSTNPEIRQAVHNKLATKEERKQAEGLWYPTHFGRRFGWRSQACATRPAAISASPTKRFIRSKASSSPISCCGTAAAEPPKSSARPPVPTPPRPASRSAASSSR